MPEYKATLRFESTAVCYIDADDEAGAKAALESLTVAGLRQATQWNQLFKTLTNLSASSIVIEKE